MAHKKRGYITIKLGGRNRTLHFSMNFWAIFTEQMGIGIDKIAETFQEGLNIKAMRSLIYAGILAYDQEEGNPIDYNEFKVGNWMEDITAEQIQEIVETMGQSRILGNDLNQGIKRNPEPQGK